MINLINIVDDKLTADRYIMVELWGNESIAFMSRHPCHGSIALWCRLVQISEDAMKTMENMDAIDENRGLCGR